jgi:hypothetical protein
MVWMAAHYHTNGVTCAEPLELVLCLPGGRHKELQRASSLLLSQLGGSVDVVLKIILDEQHLRSVLTEFVQY